jgi:Uri superfamily endonuclease
MTMMNAMSEGEIGSLIRDSLSARCAIYPDTCDLVPDAKGAYALVLRLDAPARFSRGRTSDLIAAGWYAYAGSAYGPGGLRGRLRRHFRSDKALHWHVDHLTTVASRIFAVAIEDGSECRIAARLLESGRFRYGPAGFGSSDCPTCPSHLLEWC